MELMTRRALLVTVAAPLIHRSAKGQAQEFRWVNELDDGNLAKLARLLGWSPDSLRLQLPHAKFHSARNNVEIGYHIYLPPQYETTPVRRYPVVYYLHGGRTGWEMAGVGVVRWLDQAIRAGRVPPIIYVFPNGGKLPFYDLPNVGSFGETALVKELIPHVDQNYRTIARRESRGIEGMSMGGRAAARLMFKYPEFFSSAVAMSGGHQHEKYISLHNGEDDEAPNYVFAPGDNTYDLARQYAKSRPSRLKILIAVGTKDRNYDGNLDWMRHLDSLDIRYEKIIVPDVEHDFPAMYERAGDQVMKFHSTNLLK